MSAYNYSPWNQHGPSAAADSNDYSTYQMPYQAGPAAPVNHNQGFYPPQIDTSYGQDLPASMASGQPRTGPTMYGNQFQPSALNQSSLKGPSHPHTAMRPPSLIGSQPMQPSSRGPFEAIDRPLGVAYNVGRGSRGNRNSHQKGGGREEHRGPPPLMDVAPDYRPQGLNPSMDLGERWDNSKMAWDIPPDISVSGPINSRKNRFGAGGKWGSPSNKNQNSRRNARSGRGKFDQDQFGATHGKPPPLMGFDFEVNGDNRLTRKRQPKIERREHFNPKQAKRQAKRHVDEDLKVTIMASKGAIVQGHEENKFFCTLCNATIKKGYEFQQHLRGKRHKERVAETKASGNKIKVRQSYENQRIDRQLGRQNLKNGMDDPNTVIATDQDIALDDTLTLIPLNDPEKLKFYCIICRLSLVSEMNVKAHECTPNHIKRKKEVEDLEKSKDESSSVCLHCVSVYRDSEAEEHKMLEAHKEALHWRMASCEICTRKFNDTIELQKHFKSASHFKYHKKLEKRGFNAETMQKYLEEMQLAQAVKRNSFCLICTVSFGNIENLEVHNIVAATHHEKMRSESAKAKAGPDQFYCYVCWEVVNESDRKRHGKSARHKASKSKSRSWDCEDCCVTFDEERKLYPHLLSKTHLNQVERRKAIQSYTINKFIGEWKAKQAEANAAIQAELSKRVEKEAPDGVVRQEPSSDSTKQVDLSVDSDLSVIPVSGHFCTICSTFYQFDAERENICSHVRKAKGIRDELKEPVVSKGEGNNDGAKATEAEANDEANTMERDKMDVEHSMGIKVKEPLDSSVEGNIDGTEAKQSESNDEQDSAGSDYEDLEHSINEPDQSLPAAADTKEQLEADGDYGGEREVDMENDEVEGDLMEEEDRAKKDVSELNSVDNIDEEDGLCVMSAVDSIEQSEDGNGADSIE